MHILLQEHHEHETYLTEERPVASQGTNQLYSHLSNQGIAGSK
jgi:hypothetical protein